MNRTFKAYMVILATTVFCILAAMLLYTTAPAQDLGFQWGSDLSGEEYISNYVMYREKDWTWSGVQKLCPGCFRTEEYIYKSIPWQWWMIGLDINPGYNLVFWPESSYAIVTDEDGNEYKSTEWVISSKRGKHYWTSTEGRGFTLRHKMKTNRYGHTIVLFRFDWREPPSGIVNCRFVGIEPRRLYE